MKIKLLACIAFLSLMSCSGSDDIAPVTPENPNPENPEAKELDKVIWNTYWGGDMYTYTKTFEDNKLISEVSGPIDDHYAIFYTYYENGLLSLKETYRNDELTVTEEYEYDDIGRLLSITMDNIWEGEIYMTDLIDYVYNDDNTITRTVHSGGAIRIDTYFINDQNLVYKVIGYDGEIEEAIYLGNNIVSWNGVVGIKQYSYNDIPVKGHFLNEYTNMFGSRANVVLHWNLSFAAGFADKYCTQEVRNNELVEYTYEFDEDGYPIKKTRLENGVVEEESIITYKN